MSDLPAVQAKKHIQRPSLPWRAETLTECGRPLDEMADGVVITVAEALRFWKAQGAQRAALFVCQTCVEATSRWRSWEDDPVSRLGRELPQYHYGRTGDRYEEWQAELRAIADLIREHSEEFAEAKAAYMRGSVVAIGQRRKR